MGLDVKPHRCTVETRNIQQIQMWKKNIKTGLWEEITRMRRGPLCLQWQAAEPWGWHKPAGGQKLCQSIADNVFCYQCHFSSRETQSYLPDEGLPDGLVVPGKLGFHVLVAWDTRFEECQSDKQSHRASPFQASRVFTQLLDSNGTKNRT